MNDDVIVRNSVHMLHSVECAEQAASCTGSLRGFTTLLRARSRMPASNGVHLQHKRRIEYVN